jgi:ribosomal protein S18 acetylase RimI-like enzyme
MSVEFPITVTEAAAEDVDALRPILEQSVIDSETGEVLTYEIRDILISVEHNAVNKAGKIYRVAKDAGGKVLGMMGLQRVSDPMLPFAKNAFDTGELINAFVSPDARELGIGRMLVSNLEDTARDLGYEELVVNSGPRYRETGWAFWTNLFGEPVAVMENKYGPGRDAPVWKKPIAAE